MTKSLPCSQLAPARCGERDAFFDGRSALRRQPADRLARRDPALREDLVDLHVAVLRHREQHLRHLGGEHVLRWREQQTLRVRAPRPQVALQLCALRSDLVGPLSASIRWRERALRSAGGGLRGGGHGRRLYAGRAACKVPLRNFTVANKSQTRARNRKHETRTARYAVIRAAIWQAIQDMRSRQPRRCFRAHRCTSAHASARKKCAKLLANPDRGHGSRKFSVPTATHARSLRDEVERIRPGLDSSHADHRNARAAAATSCGHLERHGAGSPDRTGRRCGAEPRLCRRPGRSPARAGC